MIRRGMLRTVQVLTRSSMEGYFMSWEGPVRALIWGRWDIVRRNGVICLGAIFYPSLLKLLWTQLRSILEENNDPLVELFSLEAEYIRLPVSVHQQVNAYYQPHFPGHMIIIPRDLWCTPDPPRLVRSFTPTWYLYMFSLEHSLMN